jgi:hypothetical protein
MNVSEYWREQSRKRRAKARQTGRCIICMTREARPDRVTCQRCCDAATAATRRRRTEPREAASAATGSEERLSA